MNRGVHEGRAWDDHTDHPMNWESYLVSELIQDSSNIFICSTYLLRIFNRGRIRSYQ